jgi:TatD DNase family protein
MMAYRIIDTHTHSYFPAIAADQESIFADCDRAGVEYQIQIGCDEISSLAALDLAKKHKPSRATLGLHPCDVKNVGVKNPEYHRYAGVEGYQMRAKNFDQLFDLFAEIFERNSELVVGFGETGFDLYHEDSPEIFALQSESFIRHIDLCQCYDRPLIVHTRNARYQTLSAFEKEIRGKNIRGVIHCFSEDLEFAQIMTQEYGFFLGIGGVLTYNRTEKIREAVLNTPIEYLVTETDSPFLVPRKAKNKGARINHPGRIPEIIELIAEIKGMKTVACAEILWENGLRLFSLGNAD